MGVIGTEADFGERESVGVLSVKLAGAGNGGLVVNNLFIVNLQYISVNTTI